MLNKMKNQSNFNKMVKEKKIQNPKNKDEIEESNI